MIRRPLGRFGALLLAIWFATATGGRATLHQCPLHDGPVPAHASHGSHHGQGHDSGSHSHNCSCIHHCCAATASVAIAGSSSEGVVFLGAMATAHVVAAAPASQEAPDFSVPFSTGPPAQVA